MQRNNNGVLSQAAACAACKHQRKKCHESCALAPYFPAERNREFQAVHKVFGVSNVTKMVKNVKEEDRRKTVDSLVWEAICRQNDPVSGPYGEYRRILEELKMYKSQNQSQNQNQNQILPFSSQVGVAYKPIMPSLGGWNSSNSMTNGNGIMGIINGGVKSNNLFNYIHDNLSAIIDSSPYSNSASAAAAATYNLQSPEKMMRLQQERDITSSVVVPLQQQQQHPNFHHCF